MNNESLNKLSQYFMRLPGIGPRQARRFIYFLLSQDDKFIKDFSDLLLEIKKATKECVSCGRFYSPPQDAKVFICEICRDINRDNSTLLVVEKDIDMESIEKTSSYKGYYFILGGLIPVMDKNPKERIRYKELLKRIKDLKDLKEIIIAVSANTEGDNTADFLKSELSKTPKNKNTKLSILGRGLSTGTELEYSDTDTLSNALKNRG